MSCGSTAPTGPPGPAHTGRSGSPWRSLRCVITYLAVPVLVPLVSLSGWVAAPVGIALCVVAVVNGIVSVRRFWAADHPRRWMYTGFMGVVFVILGIALASELTRWGVM